MDAEGLILYLLLKHRTNTVFNLIKSLRFWCLELDYLDNLHSQLFE